MGVFQKFKSWKQNRQQLASRLKTRWWYPVKTSTMQARIPRPRVVGAVPKVAPRIVSRYPLQSETQILKNLHLPANAIIADAGSDSIKHSQSLATLKQLFPTSEVIGVDSKKSRIVKGKGVERLNGNIINIDTVLGKHVDLITGFHIAPLLKPNELTKFLYSSREALKFGGKVVINAVDPKTAGTFSPHYFAKMGFDVQRFDINRNTPEGPKHYAMFVLEKTKSRFRKS